MRIIKQIMAVVGLGALLLVGAVGFSTPADAQDLDLCALLGDPYCPDGPDGPDTPGGPGGQVSCTSSAPVGGTATCSVDGADAGSLTATLVCGSYSAVVFEGTSDGSPLDFTFTVPDGTPLGSCSVVLSGSAVGNGVSLPFTVVGASLARTGSDVGPVIGIGAGLVALGAAAAYGARRRLNAAA